MAVQTGFLGSSVVKKYWMSLTGLFLIVFLIIHLIGNLQLLDLSQEGRESFNAYSAFMTSNPFIMLMSYVLYFSILFHAFEGIYIAVKNSQARSIRYKKYKPSRTFWASRNMSLLGTIILAFVVVHMAQFWYPMHWGPIGEDAAGNKDLAKVVTTIYSEGSMAIWWVLIYVVSMVAIAFHLWHGFESSFQSIGISHAKYNPVLQGIGRTYSVVVPLLFAIIPVYVYFKA